MYDKQYFRDWYEKTKPQRKIWQKEYYQKHKEHILQVHKTWAEKNVDQSGSVWRLYGRRRRIRNPNLDKEYRLRKKAQLMVKTEKNFLPSIFFNKLKNIVTNAIFSWHFLPSTTDEYYFKQDNHFMFYHVLMSQTKTTNSGWFKEFEPILYFLDSKIKLKKLLRMKLNLYTNQNKIIEHVSHTDVNDKDKPRKGVTISILNFTTCNGATLIKDKKYPSNENELLIFDNLNKHSGIVQTDTQTRIVLNIATE